VTSPDRRSELSVVDDPILADDEIIRPIGMSHVRPVPGRAAPASDPMETDARFDD
jgi:hypothetical protein